MIKDSYCTELLFEKIPQHLSKEIKEYATKLADIDHLEVYEDIVRHHFYKWYMLNDDCQAWLRENVMVGYWGVQVITQNVLPHVDRQTSARFLYHLDTGGDDVYTLFHDNDMNEIERVKMGKEKWYLLKTDVHHSVVGVNSYRIAVTCKIHPKAP